MKAREEIPSLDPIYETVRILSGKWKLQIIAFLINKEKARFMELQRGVIGISAKILSAQLQDLERYGILDRIVSDPKLTVVEYKLTKKGCSLEPLLLTMSVWAST